VYLHPPGMGRYSALPRYLKGVPWVCHAMAHNGKGTPCAYIHALSCEHHDRENVPFITEYAPYDGYIAVIQVVSSTPSTESHNHETITFGNTI
jgi:hypothetical protein